VGAPCFGGRSTRSSATGWPSVTSTLPTKISKLIGARFLFAADKAADLAVKLARAGKANGSLAILCSLLKVVPDPRPISAEMKQLRFTHEALSTIQLRQKQRKT